ncbi:hypothetical protein [Aquimarina sp. Aq107]|uniref:hypothetical protein n=1 Tax=Aquimarina sp. Aq107 TaxID=1191912 RepID=UPI0020B3E9ED|nr:hypothetical protein [Aquimarina sp. Aq107]
MTAITNGKVWIKTSFLLKFLTLKEFFIRYIIQTSIVATIEYVFKFKSQESVRALRHKKKYTVFPEISDLYS